MLAACKTMTSLHRHVICYGPLQSLRSFNRLCPQPIVPSPKMHVMQSTLRKGTFIILIWDDQFIWFKSCRNSWTYSPFNVSCAGKLKQLYKSAMQLEVQFFTEQPHGPGPPHVNMIVVDFDETCTVHDTIGLILDAAITAADQKAGGDLSNIH